VVIGVEQRGQAPGRVRMRRVADVSKDTLTEFVFDHVARHSDVRTDGWPGYFDIGKYRYQHYVTNVSASGDPAHVVLAHVHLVASLVKRWILGTHQGAVSHHQLDYYLDEFTFSLQPPALASSWPAVLAAPTGRDGDRTPPLPQPHQRNRRIASARAKSG
jgi:hypothetical protein